LVRKYGWKQLWFIVPAVAVLVLLTDQISYHLFKETVQRYRPCHNLDFGHLVHVVTKCGGQHGYLSGHATNSFGVAIFAGILLGDPRWKWGLLAWAGIVAYSRIYVGVHYPGDIISGAILGTFLGYFVAAVYKRVNQRFNPQH